MSKLRKQIGEESHVYDSLGNLQGLYTIDGREARRVFGEKRFWEGVAEIVRLYTQINPNEMKVADWENTAIRVENKNKYGSNETKSMRQALNLPHGLYLALTDYEPTLFRNKKTRTEFMKQFPVLRTCDVV